MGTWTPAEIKLKNQCIGWGMVLGSLLWAAALFFIHPTSRFAVLLMPLGIFGGLVAFALLNRRQPHA